jgi:CBS domain-containing protein
MRWGVRAEMATLGDVMSTSVATMEGSATVAEAAAEMVKGRFGSVVVTQGSMLLGIFTERDVMRAAASAADLSVDPVSRWMTPDPVTRSPQTSTDEAAELMISSGFRHLPVVDGTEMVGIVSLRDLLSSRIAR